MRGSLSIKDIRDLSSRHKTLLTCSSTFPIRIQTARG
jgi:hypothetical protein